MVWVVSQRCLLPPPGSTGFLKGSHSGILDRYALERRLSKGFGSLRVQAMGTHAGEAGMAQWRGNVRSIVLVAMLSIRVSLPAAAEVISVSVPFVSPKGSYVTHEGDYHTFRIPGMIVTQDGSVLVFAEGRRGDGSDPRRDENAPIDLVMRRSTDNGRTWQPMVVIDSGFRPSGDLLDFADPTPVLETRTGTVFLFYGQWPDIATRIVAPGQSARQWPGPLRRRGTPAFQRSR